MLLQCNWKIMGKHGWDDSDLFIMNTAYEFKEIYCIKSDPEEMKFES